MFSRKTSAGSGLWPSIKQYDWLSSLTLKKQGLLHPAHEASNKVDAMVSSWEDSGTLPSGDLAVEIPPSTLL